MNTERRKELDKAIGFIEEAKAILEQCREAEQDAYDNMPEGLQSGDKGDKAQSAISAMEEAESNLESAIDSIGSAKDE